MEVEDGLGDVSSVARLAEELGIHDQIAEALPS